MLALKKHFITRVFVETKNITVFVEMLSTNLTETLHRESLLALLRRIATSRNGSKRAVI